MIDFTLTPEQRQVQQFSKKFAQDVTTTAPSIYSKLATQKERFQSLRPLYSKAVQASLIKSAIPVPLGGLSTGLLDGAIAFEAQYAVDPSLTLTIAGTLLGLMPLMFGGTPEQHVKFLNPFLTGEGEPLASFVHSEPEGTANWLEKGAPGLRTTAKKVGGSWVVNGMKVWATNSAGWDYKGADLQCLVCRYSEGGDPQDQNSDPAGNIMILMITPEIIEQNADNAYTVLEEQELMGHRACSGPKVQFKDFKVPDGIHILAPPGKGAALTEQTFCATAGLVGCFATSIMRHSFEAALAFAKSEKRGGTKAIIEHQSVADLLMDIKMRTDSCRMLTWKALHAFENGPGDWNARLELCLETKIWCSERAVECVVDAMKAVGVTSYAAEQPFTRWLNDAMVLPLFDGGNVGIRRRQIEKIWKTEGYEPWAAF